MDIGLGFIINPQHAEQEGYSDHPFLSVTL